MSSGKTSSDLTVIFLTLNHHPQPWVDYHRQVLEAAAAGNPIITVSRQPFELGHNLIDDGPPGHLNMYHQLLKAAKLADTEYIATAEDDALYPAEHFKLRPKTAEVMYNMARWSLYWWTPVYSVKQRISNSTMIARRLPYIEALERKLARLNDRNLHYVAEVGRYESQLGLVPTPIDTSQFSEVPVIHFNPPVATDPLARQKRKRLGQMKAYSIPYWGDAVKIIDKYMKDKNGKTIDINSR